MNGKLLAEGKANGGQIPANSAYYIGRNLNGYSSAYLTRVIDDILMYDEALNHSEVSQSYSDSLTSY